MMCSGYWCVGGTAGGIDGKGCGGEGREALNGAERDW